MNRLGRAAAWLGALLLGLSACGDGGSSDKDSSRAKVVSFTAEREAIVEGESTILHWQTQGANEVILSANGLRIDEGDLPLSGSLEVSPDRDTTYRLEAVRKGGASSYREVFVEVAPFGAPLVEEFSASPEAVRTGQPVTLRYRVRGATSLEISTTRGEVVASPKAPEGEVEVRPSRSTTYVLQARNAQGETTAEVEVVVGHLPSIQLVATPSQVDFGEEIVLSWEVEDADSVVVTDPAGTILFQGPGEDGNVTTSATLSGAYRARAEGLGGEVTAEARVVVRPVVELFQATVQGSLRPGMPAFVQWKVLGAERIEIFADAVKVHETTEAEGAADLPVSETGTFTLHALAGSLDTRASADVMVTGRPVIRSVTTGPEVSAGRGVSAVSTVAWEIDGAAKLRMEVEPGGLVDLTDKSPRIDEVEVEFQGPGTVTLIASNQAGETRHTLDSPVVAVPGIERLFAAPSRVGSGEPTKILWETADAHTIVLYQDGREVTDDPSDVNGSFLTDILSAPSTFELRAYNRLGHEVRSEILTVEVGAPDNLVFGTSDGMLLYRVGELVDLVWANDGGSRLTVTDQATGDILCSTSDWVEIREGGCTIRLPEVQTKVTLALEVANASGTDVRTLDLHAVTGPIILDFQTDVDEVTEGQTVLFSWVAVPDADGNLPTLELVDDLGNVYPMDDVEPLAGSKRFRMENWGLRTFTLTARAANPPPYSVTTEVMVHGIPSVDSMAANPPFAVEEGDPITFSWSTTHGASLELYLLDRKGEPQPNPVFTTNVKSEVDQGSATIVPTIAHPDVRVVVRNPVGYATEADFRVGVDPATIASFTANGIEAPQEVEVVAGEDLTLAWETLRSDDVLLLEEYIDLSQRPNAVDLGNIGSSSTGKISFQFPEGFVFPYDGGEYTEVQIANSGYLTFDLAASASGVNQPLPYTGTTASYRAVDIAPFWDSMMNAKIWWELIEGEVDRLVIQWTNAEFSSSTYNPADLNFQVVLFEDGRFEYRYGKMDGTHAAARASLATIGAQNTDCSSGCTFGVQLVHNTEQKNGLEGRVYRFDGLRSYLPDASTPVPMPKDGSLTFKPVDTRTYTLRAWNGHSEHERDLRVVVHPRGRLEVWTVPMEPQPGEAVDLHWSGEALTSLVIEDDQGNVIHTASEAELEGGSIALGALPLGTHRYTLRGVGQLPRDQVVRTIDVPVYAPFSLDDFTVSSDRIKLGETVTLSWAATNATSVQIEAFPGGLLNLPPTPDGGSVQDQPEVTTRYVLTVESHGRVRTEELTVEVRTAWIEDFQISSTEVPHGGSITMDWEIVDPTGTARIYVEPFWREHEMREVTDVAPFQTIVGNGGVEPTASGTATTGYTDVTFPTGFVFPYFGREMTRVRAFNYGYLNFGTTQSTGTTTKYVMPRSNTTYPDGVMGVFWASLSKQATGRIFTKYVQDAANPAKDHFIIEWANFQFSSTSYNPADLNFQVVLFRDGSFDYRFGTMSSANAAQARGSSAGIGFNVGDWGPNPYNLGYQLSYNVEVPGGVANRSWRYDPPKPGATGSWTFEPQDSGLVRLCIETETWKECEEHFVTVFKPGDIVISELMVDPGSGSYQWFEIRNLAAGPFDLEGKTIRMGDDTHVVQTGGAFLIPPGGYAVLAQVDDPDLGVDYAYGLTMVMDSPAGNVAIEWDGMVLGETEWTVGWAFTPGVAKELLAVQHRPGTPTRATASEYCDSAETFGVPGAFGTPGGHGGACATVHGYEVDFAANRPFIDIRDTGRPIPHFTSTGQTYEIPGGLGFTMPFFSDFVDTLWLNSYGLMGLTGAPSNSSVNRQLGTGSGTASGQGIIAPFWDSMTTFGPDSMVYWDRRIVGGSEVLIVQFVEYKYNSTTYPGYYDFQAQLWDNGDIVFVYGDIWRTHNITNTLRYYEGYSATIGIEALNGTEAISYIYNQPLLRSFQSFLFRKL